MTSAIKTYNKNYNFKDLLDFFKNHFLDLEVTPFSTVKMKSKFLKMILIMKI